MNEREKWKCGFGGRGRRSWGGSGGVEAFVPFSEGLSAQVKMPVEGRPFGNKQKTGKRTEHRCRVFLDFSGSEVRCIEGNWSESAERKGPAGSDPHQILELPVQTSARPGEPCAACRISQLSLDCSLGLQRQSGNGTGPQDAYRQVPWCAAPHCLQGDLPRPSSLGRYPEICRPMAVSQPGQDQRRGVVNIPRSKWGLAPS